MRYKNYSQGIFLFFLAALLFFTGCAGPEFFLEKAPSVPFTWQGTSWLSHGAWVEKDGLLHLGYTWEKANYLLLKNPEISFQNGVISFSIDVFEKIDLGLLFGIETVPGEPPYIPENSFVLVIRNRDMYFNRRTVHQWQAPMEIMEIPDLGNKQLHIIMRLEGENVQVFIYNRLNGTLLASHEAELPGFKGGSIGFYSYIEQDVYTAVHFPGVYNEIF